MRKIIKKNYKFIIGIIIGLILSVSSVYAVEAYIESSKVSYNNKYSQNNNVQDAIDELYEKIGMHQEKWIEPELNGADPVLKEPLIPVEIKNDGSVYYANENTEWYNYSDKRWANAIILIDNPSNQNYKVGDKIKEADIESYFVWIPRFQYKIWDLGNYSNVIDGSAIANANGTLNSAIKGNSRVIDIKFGNAAKIPKMNEPNQVGVYYTHPAFTLNGNDLNGFWMGKFEVGYNGANSSTTASIDKEDATSVIVKPDVFVWQGISAKNSFMSCYNYHSNEGNHNDVIDPHLLRNTEWGAVAYLSHSVYGIGTEVRINNHSEYKTGYSAASDVNVNLYPMTLGTSDTITQPWNSLMGYLASTTGNISGVYDMNGGSQDLVAAYRTNTPGLSGFTTADFNTYANYLENYTNTSNLSFSSRKLGDATGEVGPFYNIPYTTGSSSDRQNLWYSDTAYIIDANNPWFIRGGSSGMGFRSGQFAFIYSNGGPYTGVGFRLALSPKN